MEQVLPYLFIGDLASARDPSLLPVHNIQNIVSVGCALVEQESRTDRNILSFADIHDTPETSIVTIFARTNAFIHTAITTKRPVLVHCVYGQSRSAAVVISYLLSIGHGLDDAMNLVKSVRPVICINPGFLAQLYVVYTKGLDSTEVRLICDTYKPSRQPPDNHGQEDKKRLDNASTDPGIVASAATTTSHGTAVGAGTLRCHTCRCSLGLNATTDIIYPLDCTPYVTANLDSYWRGYRPLHKGGTAVSAPIPGYIITGCVPAQLLPSHGREDGQVGIEGAEVGVGLSGSKEEGVATVFRTSGSTFHQHRQPHPPSTTTTSATTTTTTTSTSTSTKSTRKNAKNKQGPGLVPEPGLAPGQGLLSCPQCGTALGYHQRKGLEICAGFLRVDLYAFEERKITIA